MAIPSENEMLVGGVMSQAAIATAAMSGQVKSNSEAQSAMISCIAVLIASLESEGVAREEGRRRIYEVVDFALEKVAEQKAAQRKGVN